MENARIKTVSAIVVDYDHYRADPNVREWVRKRQGQASLIALVGSPDAEHPENYLDTDCEWDVVISNHNGSTDQVFKHNALAALKNMSNIHPVIAVDLFNDEEYRRAGVLIITRISPEDNRPIGGGW